MFGFTTRNPVGNLALVSAVSLIAAASSGVLADTLPTHPTLSTPLAGLTAVQGAFVDAQLATARSFVAQEIAASQSALAALMAENASAPSSWMMTPQSGTVPSRLADYAETLRATFDSYGDLLRLRHNRISVEFDERTADMAFAFLTTGFVLPTPNIVPIAQAYAPVVTVPDLATGFPGITPVTGGFFSSVSHQP
jgi:hypothetical protein